MRSSALIIFDVFGAEWAFYVLHKAINCITAKKKRKKSKQLFIVMNESCADSTEDTLLPEATSAEGAEL